MRSLPFLVALLASVFFTQGAAGQTIPTITAGPAQPGSADGAWINWPAISANQPQVGSEGLGYNDNVIAHWDMVQYSMQSGTFNVCVRGVHISGSLAVPLDHVTFYLDNGVGVTISSPNYLKYFSAVGLSAPEFCVQATDSSMNDGQHEFRAIVYPLRGYPRVMSSRLLISETKGQLVFGHQAHSAPLALGGDISKPFVVNSTSGSDPNLTNGNVYWTLANTSMTPSGYQISAAFQGSAITAGATGTVDITYKNAGLAEYGPTQAESLFITTNAHGTMTPTNHVVYADKTLGNTSNCFSADTACKDLPHAIDSIFVNSSAVTYTFKHGSSSISGAGNKLALNQAVTLSGSSVPAPFIAGRPYWVVASSASAITLANRPGGAAITITGSTDHTTVVTADYSGFTVYAICHAPCSSPASYNAGASQIRAHPSLYGWLNVLPNPGTTSSNVPLTGGTAYSSIGLTTKLHLGLDVRDPGGPNYASLWVYGLNDTWWDSFSYTGSDRLNKNGGLEPNGGVNTGYYGVTNLTVSNAFLPVGGAALIENITASHSGGGCPGQALLDVGNYCNNIGEDQVAGQPFTPSADSPDHFTLKLTTVPAYMLTAFYPNDWEVGTYPSFGRGYCVGSASSNFAADNGGMTVTSFSGSGPYTLGLDNTVSGGTQYLCQSGQKLWISPNVHANMTFYRGGAFNVIYAGNTCVGICAGRGFSTQSLSATNAGYGDFAVIGNNITMFYSVRDPRWQTSVLQIQATSASNFIIANNTLAGGGIATDNPKLSKNTDMYFISNQCNESTARAATKAGILSRLTGWTVIQGSTAWGNGTGC